MNINEFGFEIDATRMLDDLVLKFWEAITGLADEWADNMKTRSRIDVVKESIRAVVIKLGMEQVEIAVGSDHWKAFLDNYGTGSKMASEFQNPNLAKYKTSVYWNEFRTSNTVTKRGTGFYTVPDWEKGDGYITKFSNNNTIPAGTDLEHVSWTQYKYRYDAVSPSFFMEDSLPHIKQRLQDVIFAVYENFPFHKYVKGGG